MVLDKMGVIALASKDWTMEMTKTTPDYRKAANELYRALLISLPYVEADKCDLSNDIAQYLRDTRATYEWMIDD